MSDVAVAVTQRLSSELTGCLIAFRENRTAAHRIAEHLTPDQFNWRPGPTPWSIAQCLAHLNITAGLYADRMEAAICAGRAAGLIGDGPFTYGRLSRWVAWTADPANRKKYNTPARFAVSSARTYEPREVLEAFDAAGARWERCLHEASGLDLARVKVRSPAMRLLRLPLGALFGIQVAHERRHLIQAEAVLRLQLQDRVSSFQRSKVRLDGV